MGQISLKAVVGALAGLIAWAITEPSAPANILSAEWASFEMRLILTIGALVGGSICALSGWFQGSRGHALRGLGLGVVLAPIGIGLGYTIGSNIAALAFGPLPQAGPLPVTILWRIVALTPLGAGLGAAVGACSLIPKRALVGAIGGALGGLLGGATFDLFGILFQPFSVAFTQPTSAQIEVGGLSRAITAVLIGGFVGLFVGAMERATRTAWLRLSLGRNEGREWALDAPQNWIGRSELAHVPLFHDPAIAPAHACIVQQGGVFHILDHGSPAGTIVNGQRVQQSPLAHGSQIQIGSTVLVFLMKSGTVAIPAPAPAPVPVQIATSAQAPSLVALSGPLAGSRFAVHSPLEAGREAQGISLAFDGTASRRHARFDPSSQGVALTDLGSKNGTLVNGVKVGNALLKAGDTIQIGVTQFRVE